MNYLKQWTERTVKYIYINDPIVHLFGLGLIFISLQFIFNYLYYIDNIYANHLDIGEYKISTE